MNITKEQLAQMIDHTNLKAFSQDAAFRKLCDEAKKYGFKAIAINGAQIERCLNVAELKDGNTEYIEREMQEITQACHAHGVICKVIFENCYLTDEEKRTAAEIALKVRPDFIKTSTGFGTGGATVEDVRLMKSVVGETVKVKAAGGIRDFETAAAMIEAGAERLGTSAGVELMQHFA